MENKEENRIYVAVKGILLENGRALIVRRADIMQDDPIGWWEFAGGTLEFGESPEEALVREYREETGLDITPERLLYVTSVQMNPDYQIIVITYLCRRSGGEVRLSDEHLAYQWAGAAELRKCLAKDIAEALDKHHLWEIFEPSTGEAETGGK